MEMNRAAFWCSVCQGWPPPSPTKGDRVETDLEGWTDPGHDGAVYLRAEDGSVVQAGAGMAGQPRAGRWLHAHSAPLEDLVSP